MVLQPLQAETKFRLRLLGLLSMAGWRLLGGLLLVFAVTALVPAASALAIGTLVGRLAALTGPHAAAAASGAAWGVIALVGLLLLGHLAEQVDEALRFAVPRRIDGQVRRQARAAALAPPGIAELEDPRTQNDLAAAVDGWMGLTPGYGAVGQFWLVFRFIGAVAAAAVLARYSWLLAVGLLIAMVILRSMLRRQWLGLMGAAAGERENMRRAEYWAEIAAGPVAAKEARVFGFSPWAIARQQQQALATLREMQRKLRTVMWRQPWVFAISAAAGLASLLVPVVQTMRGQLDVGQLAAYLRATGGVLAFGSMGSEAYAIKFSQPSVAALGRLRARSGQERPAAPEAPAPPVTARGPLAIRFEQVSFCYPGSDHPVLDGLDLEVRPGEILALVGANGAGKTTLIKLLAGLYQPTGGQILVDGADLATADLTAWRSTLAVLFQDFIHYDLPARDNVTLGASGSQSAAGLAALDAVAEEAGATALLRELPAGWDTILSRAYPGGTDLSGGQWQHIAATRALFAVRAGRRILVLDEPTAHLDTRAEMAMFDSIVNASRAAEGVTVILISHRFSTVRLADRIAVLDDGRVLEAGSHDELIRRPGRYASMFELQAGRFR